MSTRFAQPAAVALAALVLAAAPTTAPAECPEGMRPLQGGRFTLADGSALVQVAPFCLDQIEVTAAGYAACVRSGACPDAGLQCGKAATYGVRGKATHPINCVTWFDADAFCRAQGKRLPTEGEWEWAARGQARASLYPWGSAAPADRACWDGKGNAAGSGGRNETCPVASHPRSDSPEGLADLGGNVREWTTGEDGRLRVVRGGSWGDSLPDFLAAGFRGMNAPDERFELTGFRCAAAPAAALGAAAPAAADRPRAAAEPIRVEVGTIRIDLQAGAGGREVARPIAVLFDLDGTLVDTVPFILASVRHCFEGYGRCPTDAEWIAGIGTPLRDQLASFARDPADVDGLFTRYRTYWLAHHDAMTRLFPGAGEAVLALRAAGHPLAVITAKIATGAERTLRHVGLWDAIDVVVAADTVEKAKPDPMPVRFALERLGRAPGEAVMIGDSNHDLAAGRAAGTATAGVLWGAASREVLAPLADHLLSERAELLPLVRALQAAR